MKMYEIKDDCYEEVMGIVKKIAKYAEQVEEALEASQINHRARKEWDDDEDEPKGRSAYRGYGYSRF